MNGIFYSPNMLQLSIKPALSSFTGKNDMKNNEYSKYPNEIKTKINDKTIPEFGNFAPVSAGIVLKNKNGIAFQVKPSKKNTARKELTISFINAKTKDLSMQTKVFQNKDELLQYINSIDEESMEKMVKEFEADTEDV